MAAPVVYVPVNTFGGMAKEVTPGTPVPMTTTLGTAKPVEWKDVPNWLEDVSLRGVMTDGPFASLQGVTACDVTFPESPVYVDSVGFPLANILGDVTTTGASAPYSNAISLLNTLTGQGTLHTYEQYYGPTVTSGARFFSSLAFSEVVLMWDVAKKWLTWSGKAKAWMSTAAGAKPTDAQSSVQPIPSWRNTMGLGGPASGGTQVLTCKSGKITIKREVTPEYTGSSTQSPFAMVRGSANAQFDDLVYVTQDESIYAYMAAGTIPQFQLVFDNGLAAAAHGALQIDAQAASFRKTDPDFSGKLISWKASGKFQANTTNAGVSGGQSPLKVTLTNAIASGTYV